MTRYNKLHIKHKAYRLVAPTARIALVVMVFSFVLAILNFPLSSLWVQTTGTATFVAFLVCTFGLPILVIRGAVGMFNLLRKGDPYEYK